MDAKTFFKGLLNLVCFICFIALVIVGHKQVGLGGLGLEALGLAGLLVQLYFYNRGK